MFSIDCVHTVIGELSEDLVVEKAYDVAPLDVEVVHAMRSVDLRGG